MTDGDPPPGAFQQSEAGELVVGPPPTDLPTKPFDPEPYREIVRAVVAFALILCVIGEIAFLLAAVPLGWLDMAGVKELAGLALTPTIGLAGAAIGFYYAGRRN